MEKIENNLGKAIFESHFKIGSWYKIPGNRSCCPSYKYLKIDKLTYKGDRLYIYGKGFEVIKDKLNTPKIKGEENFPCCWAKDYVEKMPELTEKEVKNIFEEAVKNIYNLYF